MQSKAGEISRYFIGTKLMIYNMKKEIRQDLYTQTEYAKLIKVSQARVNQMMKEGKLDVVWVNGAVLIKQQ